MCPLCEQGRMFLTELKSTNQMMGNKSYMWICEECPGILMEWYTFSDQEAFNKRLMGDLSDVIKVWEAPEDVMNSDVAKDLLKEE
jgi:hypothetical protein